ncbi:hypothetical protein HZ326_26910 [Fusarium oxysporum f. sp. albedinis]|nr:hypothetical protein HZ326_27082 [Fusarium oxysporum f. sp. albedinis]KAJ0129991.1 hypothetical protein HZ326_26910 [Fusarium oxysporum f. sp. albedinis]
MTMSCVEPFRHTNSNWVWAGICPRLRHVLSDSQERFKRPSTAQGRLLCTLSGIVGDPQRVVKDCTFDPTARLEV